MADNYNEQAVNVESVETNDRGLFDLGKKEDVPQNVDAAPEDEKLATDFDNKVDLTEAVDNKNKNDGLLRKLNRSSSSSSSSSEEEGDDEETKQRKKEKKGLKEKLLEKLPGHDNEEDAPMPISTPEAHLEEDVEKKGIVDKIKDKITGDKPAEEDHHDVVVDPSVEVEAQDKKGLLEKIKDKIPGLGGNTDAEEKKDSDE